MTRAFSSHTAGCAAAVLLCAVALALTAAPTGAWPPMGAGTIVGPFVAVGVDGDSPPDGRFDLVLVNASIDVSIGGDFWLFVQRDRYQWIGGQSFSLEVGLNPVQVPIDGVYLGQLGVNGPMDLTLILEAGCPQGCQIIDQASFRTSSFRLTDFATPPKMTFPRPASDFAVDDDQPPDGRFDFVAVDVPVWVEKPGPYTLIGVYLSQARQVFNATNLEAGNSTIRLMIPGRDLRAVHVNGQFHLSLSMGSATGEHWTRSYLWSDFAEEGATFGSGFRDAGLDTDVPSNGLYDVLRLQIPIHVTRSGDYRIGGTLTSTVSPWPVAWASRPAYLSAGERQLDLQFPANQIVASAVNGSFRASVTLVDDFGVVDSANATTGNYSWTDFDPPSLVLSGPITDSYVDIDSPSDGIFDRYVVQVPIEVREAGRYAFAGLLYAAGRQMYASNLSDLAPGSSSVQLTWPLGSFTSVGAIPSGQASVFAYRSQYESAFSTSFTPSPPPAGGNGTANLAGPELRVDGMPVTTLPDANGNGLFDSLVYKLPVSVTRAGPYGFTATLMAFANNYRVAHTTTHVVLPSGRSTVSLTFPAFSIRASHLGGPYTVYVRYWAGPTDPWPHEYDQQGESFTGFTPVLFSHQFEADRPVLPSASLTAAIVPDGVLESAEWAGISSFDLSGGDPGALPSRAFIANDAQNLYVALDVVGDRTADSLDSAGIGFDVKTLGSFDFGSDDEIGVGSTFALSEKTFRLAALPTWCCGGYWILREAPFDHAAPERANLDAAIGFAASPADSVPHRTFEFRVPLALLDARPGDTIGFSVYSTFTMGIRDASGRRLAWPASPAAFESLLPSEFGRIALSGGPNRGPTVAWSAPLGGAYLSGVLHASGAAGDPDGTVQAVEVRVDQGPWVRASGTTTWSFDLDTKTMTDGPHTFAVRSSDGSVYSEEVSVAFTVDNTPPSVAILSPSDGTALPQAPITVSWSSQDATSGVDRVILRIDGGEPLALQGPTSHRIQSLPDGVHEIRVTAVDRAGNERSSSITITLGGPSAIAPSGFVIGVGLGAGVIAAVGVAAFLVTRRRRDKRT